MARSNVSLHSPYNLYPCGLRRFGFIYVARQFKINPSTSFRQRAAASMSLSARFTKIKTTGAPTKVGAKASGGNTKRGGAKAGVSARGSKAAKEKSTKQASKNKLAEVMKSRRMGTKQKSMKEAAKGMAKAFR